MRGKPDCSLDLIQDTVAEKTIRDGFSRTTPTRRCALRAEYDSPKACGEIIEECRGNSRARGISLVRF
jgi:hypothetical protein